MVFSLTALHIQTKSITGEREKQVPVSTIAIENVPLAQQGLSEHLRI